MGWGNCGKDSQGRPIGYAHVAVCDHPDCNTKIHRGLAYACGLMHGENGYDCDGYFCEEHLVYAETPEGEIIQLCDNCAKQLC